jgi:hypothetical protein
VATKPVSASRLEWYVKQFERKAPADQSVQIVQLFWNRPKLLMQMSEKMMETYVADKKGKKRAAENMRRDDKNKERRSSAASSSAAAADVEEDSEMNELDFENLIQSEDSESESGNVVGIPVLEEEAAVVAGPAVDSEKTGNGEEKP